MVPQTIDSKFSEYGLRNPENISPTCDGQPPVDEKKTPLRDLQNENGTVLNTPGSSPFSKDGGPVADPIKVAGTKRSSPEFPVSPSQCRSPSTSPANGHLVYVRRKSETEVGKSSGFDSPGTSTCQQLRQVGQVEEIDQQISQIKEQKASCFQAFAPLPMTSLASSSAEPSVPSPPGKSAARLAPSEANQNPVVSEAPFTDSPKRFKELHWEDQYYQLQILLKKLDQSVQEDYVQMLRSLSAVELSRHAIELEKRSIQLSLEEGKELHRVGVLNVLGKNMKTAKALPSQPDESYR